MSIPKVQIAAKINVPSAVACVAADFGDATGFGKRESCGVPGKPELQASRC